MSLKITDDNIVGAIRKDTRVRLSISLLLHRVRDIITYCPKFKKVT